MFNSHVFFIISKVIWDIQVSILIRIRIFLKFILKMKNGQIS